MTNSKAVIKFQDTGYFSKLMCDYLERKEAVQDFYGHYPDIKGFKKQIEEKSASFPEQHRKVLFNSVKHQLKDLTLSPLSEKNLNLLKDPATFTVTTGHQLNLFTGPLYFLYKIISTINLAKTLKQNFPGYSFVPIYWMATEDHDFEEICFFNVRGNKLEWKKDAKGAVGRIDTKGLEVVFKEFESVIGESEHAEILKEMFENAYLKHESLTEATRYLANELFKDYGLIIVDGDDRGLKSLMTPHFKRELQQRTSFNEVSKTNVILGKGYDIQVNPREINLFYLDDGIRERIIFEDGVFRVNDTKLVFTEDELLALLDRSPEKFSPNVLLRPLFQEVILPNLCYIGGGGEMAYWLQLRSFFKKAGVSFPILLLRNSALLINEKQKRKLKALDISETELFLKQHVLIEKKVRKVSSLDIDFTNQKRQLQQLFDGLKDLSEKTDKSFTGAVLAQEKKQLNGMDKLEKRMLRAQKRKFKELVTRITILQDQLFPNQSLQERQANFSEFYDVLGEDLIPMLVGVLNPLDLEFDIIGYDA